MKYLAFLLLICFQAVSAERYVINVTESMAESPYRASLEGVLTLAYSKLGIKPEFKYYPSNRGIKLVSTNLLDAEASRLGMISQEYPKLVKVNEPLADLQLGLFCLKKQDCVLEQAGIYTRLQGFESADIICEEYKVTCIKTDQYSNIVKMMQKGRVTALLALFHDVPHALCSSGVSSFYYAKVKTGKINNYHFVSKENASLAPKLAVALKQIKQSYSASTLGKSWQELAEDCGLSLTKLTN